ncbi:DUF3419 family protein [Aeromonas sp. OTU364]|uniref:DUF3419 family protein n=1 Tax=Aeromonas sp. OTU364 TaxID=3043864 RepID=UPI00313ABA77
MSSLYSHQPQSSRDGVDLPLMYGQGREDVRVDLNALSIQPSDKVLVISSGGCSALRLLAEGPALMTSIDLNRTQNYLLELKRAAIRVFDRSTYIKFLGEKDASPLERQGLLDMLWDDLSDDATAYWKTHRRQVNRGVNYAGRTDRLSRITGLILRYLTHSPRVFDEIMALQTLEEQRAYFRERFNNRRWRAFLRLCLNSYTLRRIYGEGFSKYLADDATLSQHLERKIEKAFYSTMINKNGLMTQLLFGRPPAEGTCAPYLTDSVYQRVKQNLEQLHVVSANLLDFIARTDLQQTYSKVTLSNVIECVPQDTLQLFFIQLSAFLPSGGVVVMRSMIGHQKHYLPPELEIDHSLSEQLTAQEQTYMYSNVSVIKKR